MEKVNITLLGHPVLRAKAAPIETIDDAVHHLAEEMLYTMEELQGCGLAANQVGVARRIIVLDTRGVKNRPSVLRIAGKSRPVHKHMPMILINPELEFGAAREIGFEGCLSIPGTQGDVERAQWVRVRGVNLEGQAVDFEAEGLLSRALQHEVDHLNGILFIDHLSEEERRRAVDEFELLMKDTASR